MNTLTNIKRIIFYGCSYTAGSELSDIELFPNYTKEEIDKLKLKERYSVYNRVDGKIRNNLDNQKSWTRWFSDEIGIPWANRAIAGASMGEIIFNIEQDLINGSIENTDVIIVGITGPGRLCRFDENGAQSLIINNLDNRWNNASFREDFIKEIATDEYILYNWIKDIRYLDMLSSKMQDRIFLQWVWASASEIFKFHTDGVPFYNLYDYMSKLINGSINIDSIIDNDFSFSTLNAWDLGNHEVFYHPKLELHQVFGKSVAQAFKEKISLN